MKNLLKKLPRLYNLLKALNIKVRIFGQRGGVMGWLTFQYFRLTGKAQTGKWFGHYMLDPTTMESFIKQYAKAGDKMLEVGSWTGASALIWAKQLQKLGGRLYCIDHFGVTDAVSQKVVDYMEALSKDDGLVRTFLHNIKAGGLRDTVTTLIGKSQEILPILKESFDIIYIDAGHSYSNVKHDIQACIPLLKEGGILCGDDLNLDITKVNRVNAEANKETDTVIQEGGYSYHPGVTLAVAELLGDVWYKAPFWAVIKSNGKWEKL